MATPTSLANPDSLAVLTDAVNQTLIDTGRFFKSSGSLQSRVQLKTSIPASYQRFQIALDTLSEQIFIAKAFLEKDYENAIAKKAAPKPGPEPVPEPEPVSAPPPPAPAPPAEDVPMLEAPSSTTGEQGKESAERSELPEPPIKTEPVAAPDTMQFEEKIEAKTENIPAIPPIEGLKTDDTTDKVDQSLPLATGDEMNFDSMLATTGEAPNDFDLNFNFTNDEIGDQNFLAGTDFGNGNSGLAGDTSNDNAPGSISSLLPGLESYATDNNAGDSFNFDLPKLGDQGFDPGNAGQDDLMAPGESSFDDLFLEKDNLEGEDSLLGGDLMDLGELDDSWLN